MTGEPELTYTRTERAFVATSAILGYGLDFYNLIIMAFLLAPVQKALGISLPQTGIIVAMTLTASVVGGILFGWLGDKIGRKNALLATLLLLGAGAVLSAFAWDFASLLVFRIVTGIGVGGEWGAGMVLLNEVWHRDRRGFGSSVVQAMSSAGIALASIVATLSLANIEGDWAWRLPLLVGALPLFLMLFVRSKMPESRLWVEYQRRRERGELPPEKLAEGTPLIEIVRGASLQYFIVGTLLCGAFIINYQSISVFMPLLMIRDLGANLPAIRNTTLLFALISAIGMIGTGLLSDRFGRRRAVILSALMSAVALAGIYATGTGRYPGGIWAWPLVWCYVLWGFGQGAFGQFGPWFSELYPVEMRSTAASTIFTAGRLIGSMAPYGVPVLAGTLGSLLDAMMLAVIGSVVTLLLAFVLPETVGRPFAVVESKERAA
jgi:MFS family permease